MVISPPMATTGPDVLPVLTLSVNVSDPSVSKSALGVTLNAPTPLVMLNEPLSVLKSALELLVLLMDQYSVAPLLTPVVVTVAVRALPSLMFAADEI